MKTKHLLMTLLLALFVPWAAQAQLTMTVCEGEVTNLAIPLNGYSTDTQGSCGEFIIPASQLSGMIGSEISQISFYPRAGYNWSTTFQVYVKEVEYTTLSGTIGPDACTVVYTGSLDASGSTMDIPFGDNYSYSGGNLLIGTYISVSGNYIDNAYFYGIEAEGAAYASGTYSGTYNGSYNFIPKTTFTYFPADFCYEPANVHIVENTLGPREVAIEWDAESGELFEESMQATSSFDPNNIHWSGASTSHFEEWDQLTPDTDYTFCVRKKCGTDSYSQPVFLEFRTTAACPAPTLALVANSETARGATLNWTGFSDSYILQMGSIASTQTQTILSEDFESGSMPTGWTTTTTGSNNWSVSSTVCNGVSLYGESDYAAGTPNGTSSRTEQMYLITPEMDLRNATSVTLHFYYYQSAWGSDVDPFGVYYRVNGGAWNELFYSTSSTSSWTEKSIELTGLAAKYQIGFYRKDNWAYGVAVDDIEITAEVLTYEWITFDNNATSPYTFTTLLPETTYYTRVIGNCGSDGQSQPSNMVSFTTLASCPVPTALNVPETTITAHEATLLWTADNDSYNIRYMVDNDITEGFEGGTLPNGWTVTSTGSNNWAVASSVISGVAPHGGSYAIGTPSGTSSRSEEMYLISPSMDLSTATSATLHFYYYQKAWGSDIDPFGVYYRVNGGSWQQLFYSTEATSEWTEKTIELQGLAANYQIGFYRKDNYAYGNAIDDIQISIEDPTATWQTATSNTTSYHFTGLDPETKYTVQVQGVCGSETTNWSEAISFTTLIACPAPTNLVYDNVTKNSVELSWTETGGATEWEICINGDEENLVGVMENPYTLDRLDPQTDYTVKVRAVCGGEDGESQWSNTISFTTIVACPAPTNLTISSNPTYNSVGLTWTETGEATEWEICVNGDTENLIGVTENPYTLNRLDPETDYTVKVRAVCGGDDGESQWSNTVSFTTLATCPVPQNLVVTTDGATATATWTDTEGTCNISINGTVTNNVTSPYTFNVNLSTTYEVMVQANCTGETSGWSEAYSFTTPPCLGGHVIEYTLNDSYGDGWTGSSNNPTISAILINDACGVYETLTLPASTFTGSGSLTLCGEYYQLVWQAGAYPGECSFTLIVDGTPVYTNQSGSSLTEGQVLLTLGTAPDMLPKPTDLDNGTPDKREVVLSWTENGTATAWEICVNGDEDNPIGVRENPYTLDGLTPDTDYAVKVRATDGTNVSCWTDEINFTTAEACAKPTNLAENNITINSATLSWDGSSDSYEVQLMPWYPAGEDVLPTGTLQTYSFPLEGTGTGNVVIRHYDVSNMFRLNIDDIVITNANDEVVYSQNFESCGGTMPSEFTLIDRDGDGQNWYVVSGNVTVNGNYGLTSASWNNGNVLYPDNWLVLSNVQLGGKISFVACGQDPSFAAEKFCVYVQKESDLIEEITDNTVLPVSNLVPRTPYDWTVKGFCGTEYETTPVPSYFETKDDVIVFATDGNWNEDNWVDWNGEPTTAPTANDKVRIDADAIIPANYVAYAKSIKIGVGTDGVTPLGSITIKDGGQLKQNGVVDVIVEKEITGYGTGEGNWYFIATPLTTTHFNSIVTDWSYVNALDGTYDLYTFDPTAEKEWINYRFAGNDAFVSGSNTGVFATQVGYLYANEEDLTLQFEGSTAQKSLNNVVTEDFTYDANATYNLNGWSLVGNPFTCNAYITYLVGGQPIEANFYALNAEGNGYVECDSDDPLAPCTGAFIYYDQDVTIQYSTEQPIAKSTGMLNMTLSQGRGSIDQSRLRFGRGYNLKHMSFRENSSISMPVEGNDYAVVYAEGNGEMPVNFKAERNGTYTLGFNTENVEFSYLHLIDNLTGNDVDLLANSSYSFEAQTTDYASRFKLVFATGSNDDNFAFFNNGNIIVNNEGEATLQVMDVNGRIIRSESINGTASIKMNASAGVYMLRLINGNDVKVQKMIVK